MVSLGLNKRDFFITHKFPNTKLFKFILKLQSRQAIISRASLYFIYLLTALIVEINNDGLQL